MDKKIKYWMKLMDFFYKYWGCHQLPTRSFFYHGYQFPVCARCTGIIFGYLFGVVLIIFNINVPFYILLLCMVPCAIDGTIQFFTNYESNNFRRLITGFFGGASFLFLVLRLIIFLIKLI